MFNCYKLFFHDRLIAVFHSFDQCETYISMACERFDNQSPEDYDFQGAYIERIGF